MRYVEQRGRYIEYAKTGDEVARLKARSATSFLGGIVAHDGLIVCGAAGRMGRRIVALAQEDPGVEIVAAKETQSESLAR